MPEEISDEILALLKDERAAIRRADFDELEKLTQTKEKLFVELQSEAPGEITLSRIKDLLNTNQALLSAAIKGVNDAKARLLEIAEVQKGLRFYDPTGQMAQVETRRSALEKKA
ncbi:MAG: hypothetical protein AAFY31_06500 [Pseudomonadota bacterium]